MTAARPRPVPGPQAPFRLPPREVTRLGNGMRATFVAAGTVPIAAIRLVIRTGSADVPQGQTWLDRFVHEYLREGTATLDAAQLAEAFASIGGRFSVDADEHTTVLRTDVLAEHAPRAIALLAEIARAPRLPDDEAARLRTDLRRNLDMALVQPQFLTFAKFRSALYGTHPYGRVIPQGEVIDAFDAGQARAFWAAETGAQRAHLLVGGRFDAQRVTTAVHAAFDDWSAGPAPVDVTPTPTRGRRIYVIDRPGAEQSTMYVGLPVIDPTQPDYVGLEVTNMLLGGSFHSRITMNIREDKGYTYSPYSAVSSRPHDAYWVEAADVTTSVTGAALTEILGEMDRLGATPPDVAELAGIQNYAAGSFVLRQATASGILDSLEFLDMHGLDAGYAEAYVDRVRAVTPETVQRIAATYLPSAPVTVVVAGDRAAIDAQLAPFGTIEA